MINNFEKDFKVLYESDSTSNYLVLKNRRGQNVINYQAQMLLNNKLNGLLNFNINRIGDEVNCFYNITSKCTLVSFVTRKYFSRDEFLKTILNIINNIYQLKNYLLYDNNILLNENFIYVEPDNINIYFVYLPFQDCKSDINAFFTKLIFHMVKFNDEYSDNYIQKILEVIKNDNFSLCNLKSLIESLLCEGVKNYSKYPEGFDNTVANTDTNLNNGNLQVKRARQDKIFGNWFNSDKAGIKKATTEVQIDKTIKADKIKKDIAKANKTDDNRNLLTRGNLRIPYSQNTKKQECMNTERYSEIQKSSISSATSKSTTYNQYKDSKSEVKLENNKKMNIFLLALILLQPFLLVGLVLIINSEFVRLSDNPKYTVTILVSIFLAVDVLLIRLLNEKAKLIGDYFTPNKKTDQSNKPLQIISNVDSKAVNKDEEILSSIKEEKLNDVSENYSGETVIIKRPKLTGAPYLKAKDGDEVIKIDKSSILIGRMDNFVDYIINSSAIGKIHAEILREGDELYVMDCNSRNGTFLNDNRILPNTKNSVKNNDIIRFANKEFVFCYSVKAEIG